MNKNLSLVTGFIDIGRENWTYDSSRSIDKYFEYFSNLAKIENDMYVFIEEKFVDKILLARNGKKTYIEIVNIKNDFSNLLKDIDNIQKSDYFKNLLNKKDLNNPDYCSPEYVLVMLSKVYYVNLFIKKYKIDSNLIAWVDFGYVRNSSMIKKDKTFHIKFNEEKIHLLSLKEINEDVDVKKAMLTNDVFITGSQIIASKKMWSMLNIFINNSIQECIKNGIIDDDQGILLDCYIKNKDFFELHNTNGQWFKMFEYGEWF